MEETSSDSLAAIPQALSKSFRTVLSLFRKRFFPFFCLSPATSLAQSGLLYNGSTFLLVAY